MIGLAASGVIKEEKADSNGVINIIITMWGHTNRNFRFCFVLYFFW